MLIPYIHVLQGCASTPCQPHSAELPWSAGRTCSSAGLGSHCCSSLGLHGKESSASRLACMAGPAWLVLRAAGLNAHHGERHVARGL